MSAGDVAVLVMLLGAVFAPVLIWLVSGLRGGWYSHWRRPDDDNQP